LQKQESDNPPLPFSFLNNAVNIPLERMVSCYQTFTTFSTHKIVSENLHLAPKLIGNEGKGNGPRYCPSLEAKVIKYPEKKHHIWLEPEGLSTDIVYPNGISCSLPERIQLALLQTIPGLENVVMIRPGYSVEYLYCDPTLLFPSLETKLVKSLFFAGQLNGTTGYEEAGAQGIVAGINAALNVLGKPPMIIDRSQAYIGVLIDDLITRGTDEPYRMFTSRSEYRLTLRADNADQRLTEFGYKIGFVSKTRMDKLNTKLEKLRKCLHLLEEFCLTPQEWSKYSIPLNPDGPFRKWNVREILSKHHDSVNWKKLITIFPSLSNVDAEIAKQIEIQSCYASHLERQQKEIEAFRRDQNMELPTDLDYDLLPFLSIEEKEKLSKLRPSSIASASNISGITPSSIISLLKVVKRYSAR